MSELESFVPTTSAIRRALRRADDGAVLNALEAETLLHVRGDDLERLLDIMLGSDRSDFD